MFNSMYKMLTSFVDPATVSKLRFAKGPDGKGGGADLRTVFREYFSDETSEWLITEMRMHRKMWPEVKANKSWLASIIRGDGKLPVAVGTEFELHDNRGTAEFIASDAGKYAESFARSHALKFPVAAKQLPKEYAHVALPKFCAPVVEEVQIFDRFE